jgi:uncharacterized membrane protein YfcA
VAVSFINSVSGGGSILSLPLLIFLGLPAAAANGTNRLGVLLGSGASLLAFRSKGIYVPRLAFQVGWPAAIGSLAGSLIAVRLPDRIFAPILAGVILFVVIMTFRGRGADSRPGETPRLRNDWVALAAYTGIGFYGGFIQAGSGLIMMYVYGRMGNLDLIRINALKVSNTVIFISVSLAAFAFAGAIDWPMAAALAAGNLTGGWMGSLWQIHKGEAWVNRFLLVTGIAMAGALLWKTWTGWGR